MTATTPVDPGAEPIVRSVAHVMGMPISLALRGRHAADEAGRSAWIEVMASLREADLVFSTYRPESVISRLGRGEIGPGDCPPEVAEVLALGERATEQSGGAFAVRRPGPDGAPVLDPSGVVKGWAAERAYRAARIAEGYLNAGGDLVLTGPPRSWRIGIEHPADPRGLLTVVAVGTGGIATSGRAHRGAHLWDPATGRAAAGRCQATVVGPTLTWADILATAAAVAGPDRLDRSGWPPGYEVLLAEPDGTASVSAGFPALLADDLPPLRTVELP